MNNKKNRVFGNSEQPQFPDLIKAGLKVGDKVYSYLYGEGVVVEIEHKDHFPIGVVFNQRGKTDYFTAQGFFFHTNLIPSIHLQPWNPIEGEPFPFPKWQPIVGEVYAFWQDENVGSIFNVGRFTGMSMSRYVCNDIYGFYNCAPISEAMRIFGFDKVGEGRP
jgi:hypothetical protein